VLQSIVVSSARDSDEIPLFYGLVDNSLPICKLGPAMWEYARGITSVVYRRLWHKSALSLCIMMLNVPTVIDRYVPLLLWKPSFYMWLTKFLRPLLAGSVPGQGGNTLSQYAQRLLIQWLKIAPTDNDDLNTLRAAGNPFPLELGYEHGFDEALQGEEALLSA